MTSDKAGVDVSRVPGVKHKKVRTGCRTCKLRRVKCDESYPACKRCVSMGRVCDGYGVWGGGGLSTGSFKVASRRSASQKLPAGTSIGTGMSMSSVLLPGPHVSGEEQIYLEWFIHGTAANTPRIFNSPFWDPVILQAAVHEPMVLHALLALSSAHKRKIMDPANRVREELSPDAQEMFLLKQYSRAIQKMQRHLNDPNRPTRPKLLVAVIMCALFVLLEYTRGRYDNGYVHLASGAKLAEQLMNEPSETQCNLKLIHFFARLQDQTNIFHMLQPAPHKDSTLGSGPASIPILRFENIDEARSHLDALIDAMAHSVEQARMIPFSARGSRRMLEEEHAYLMASFEAWLLAYEATMEEREAILPLKEVKEWHNLRQHFAMTMDISDIGIQDSDVCYTGDAALRKMANCIAQKGRDRLAGKIISAPVKDAGVAKALIFAGTRWTAIEY